MSPACTAAVALAPDNPAAAPVLAAGSGRSGSAEVARSLVDRMPCSLSIQPTAGPEDPIETLLERLRMSFWMSLKPGFTCQSYSLRAYVDGEAQAVGGDGGERGSGLGVGSYVRLDAGSRVRSSLAPTVCDLVVVPCTAHHRGHYYTFRLRDCLPDVSLRDLVPSLIRLAPLQASQGQHEARLHSRLATLQEQPRAEA